MTPARTRVLVIGIDAASPDLLTRWAADGTLPNLRALMDRGVVGTTRTTDGVYIAATWPSLYTGVNPARHGIHYLFQLKPGTYRYQQVRLEREAFWHHLTRAGKRLALIDIPLSRVSPSPSGIHIVDWSGIETTFGFETSPPELRGEIVSRWGKYPLEVACDGLRRGADEFGALVDKLVRGTRLRADMTTDFLERGGWDFFMQVFTEAHCAGHQCWHLHDSRHPAHDPAVAARVGDPMRRVLEGVDAAIGRIVAAAGDATVMVFTAHGMSHWYGVQFMLPEILFRLGAAYPLPPAPVTRGLGHTAMDAARQVWRRLPQSVRESLSPLRDALRRRESGPPSLPTLDVDTARSRCFMVRNGNLTGGIRLNLIGREPTGVLAPGDDAERFVAELTRDLMDIVDDRTGRPAARRVIRTSDLYQGELRDALPDLLVDWDDAAPTGSVHHAGGAASAVRLRSARIGTLEAVNEFTRTGDHRIGGMFVAAGPGLAQGRIDRVLSIMDFAPTFTAMLGVQMPDVDGKPIPELLPGGGMARG